LTYINNKIFRKGTQKNNISCKNSIFFFFFFFFDYQVITCFILKKKRLYFIKKNVLEGVVLNYFALFSQQNSEKKLRIEKNGTLKMFNVQLGS